MQSRLEGVDRRRVWGWAWHPQRPELPVRIAVSVDGVAAGEVLAETYRGDLAQAGMRDGRAAFELYLPEIAPGAHDIAVFGDGVELQGSPAVLPDLAALVRAAEAANEPPPDYAARRRNVAVVIDDAVPRADRDAGSQAVISHMRSLMRLGFDVVFVAGSDAAADPLGAERLGGMGITVLAQGAGEALRGLRRAASLVYLHRLSNATRWMDEARAWCPGARVIYSVAELNHLLLARMAAFRPVSPDVARVRAAELGAAGRADAVITHSLFEADLLRVALPGTAVFCVPWEVSPAPLPVPFGARRGVGYVGSFGQPHDIDAAEMLLREIMPRVHRRDSRIPLVLAGSAMPSDLSRLAGPGVVLLGRVAHIADVYARVRLSLAPLRFAAGMKGKILESMAYGVACIASPVAVDGMAEIGAALTLAAEPADIAEAILRLHADAGAASAQAGRALQWLAAHVSPGRIDEAMAQAALVR
jgi:glycosyltransferase involved in cell wall biosynthesis